VEGWRPGCARVEGSQGRVCQAAVAADGIFRQTTTKLANRWIKGHGWDTLMPALEDLMNRFLVAALLCAAFSFNALAQNPADAPASKEDVERYFEAIHSHDMMQKMVEAMAKPMHQLAHEQCAKYQDKLPADCEAQMNKHMDAMWKEMPFDEIMQAMVPAYQKHFSKGDIDALVAFYSTPTGQKMLETMPAVMSESMESMMPIMRKAIDKMTERTQQEIAQMMKDSQKKAGEGTPSAEKQN
jgi:hypothetical protein